MKSKFKAGDIVKCNSSCTGAFTLGKTYVVKSEELNRFNHLTLEKDDNGSETNGWEERFFELIETKQENTMINYHVLNDSIVLNYNGKTQNIASDDSRYADVLTCIRNNTLDRIPELVETERAFQGSGVELRDGLLWEGENPFPAELSQRILMFKEKKLPYKPLLKFWDNLKKNPSFNSRKMMFAFLEHNGHPLTQDGCFIAYRGVTEDFKDKHTKTFDNKPGSICEMPRQNVNDNPNETCSHGLHVACFDYAKGFGEKLVEVKVNPSDVVCVPVDYSGTKMRVCKFEVVQECAAMLEGLVYDKEEEIEEDFETDAEDAGVDFGDEDFEDLQDALDAEDEENALAVVPKTLLAKSPAPNYRYAKRDKNGKFVSKKKNKRKKSK